MKRSESINEIATALAKAQGMMKPVSKDNENPFFKSKYFDIAVAFESVRIPLSSNGIAVLQEPMTVEDKVSVTTTLVHSSGQFIEFEPLLLTPNKKDAQGIGSAITYAKRYSLCAALGIVHKDEDDDGNAACQTKEPKQKKDRFNKKEQDEYLNCLVKDLKTNFDEVVSFAWAYAKREGIGNDFEGAVYLMSYDPDIANRFKTWQDIVSSMNAKKVEPVQN